MHPMLGSSYILEITGHWIFNNRSKTM